MVLHRRGESGNVFFTLFGAIALIGVIGVATSTLMRGPVGTVMNINQRAKADSQLQIARKLVALNAVNTAGDCENTAPYATGDGYVEPSPPDGASPGCAGLLTGGGCIPTTIGAARTDPWGTLVGYCAWNHGPSTAGNGCSAGLLAGDSNATTAPSKVVIAIISAGPDRQFQSTCGADPAYVARGGDDIVDQWTMSEAQTLGGSGLWTLVSGNPGAITTNKDVDISNNSNFASGTTATFQGNAAFNAGSQLSLANGALFNLPTQATLPDSACQGAAATANDGVLRINTATGRMVQICDPTSAAATKWVNIGGGTGLKLDDMVDAVSDFAAGGNLFLGNGSGGAMVSGSAAQNVAVGVGAGSALTTGQNNVLLGFDAGDTITTENGNILIGDNADITAGQSNRIDIGNLIYGDMGAGRIGIGTPTPGATLDVNGTLNAAGNGSIGGALNVGGGATVSGAATMGSTLDVTGAANLGSTLSVTGNVSSPGGTVNVASGLTATGPVNFGGTMAVAGASTINNTLHVTGAGTMDADLAVLGNTAVTGDIAGGSLRLGPITSGIGLFSDGSSGLQLQTNALKRLQITSGGAVGIGVASPSTLLDVGGGIRMGLEAGVCGPTLYGTLRYTAATDLIEACSNTNAWVTVGTSGGGGGGSGGFWLAGLPGGSGAIYYSIGNVGIGTTTPLAPLHVTGNFADTGSYTGTPAVPVSGAGTRMFFDVASGSFRAGSVTGTQWDSANTGNRSLSFGLDTVASGAGSLSMGSYTLASGDSSMALGSYVLAGNGAPGVNGNNSLALGLTGVNTPNRAAVTGNGSLGIFMQDQHNKTLAANNTMGLFGGRLVIDPNSQATLMAPNPNTDLNVNGNIGSVNFCDVDGNNCFTAADVASGSTGAPGGDRQVVYNSTGTLAADAGLVYTATGRLGVNSAAPATRLEIGGTLRIADGGEACAAGTAGGIRYNGGSLQYCDGTAWQLLASSGAGGVTAAGSDSQVQFNNGGILGANANFVWDNTNGRLGIGTAVPGAPLQVAGAVPQIVIGDGSNASSYLSIDGNRALFGNAAGLFAGIGGVAINASGSKGIQMFVNGTGALASGTMGLAITSAGRTGVGTTGPATLLDVAGTLRVADGGETCAAGVAGGIRYSGTSLQYCDGTAWNTLSIASGNPPWNTISNPTGNQALTMGGFTSTFTYNAATGAANLFNLTDAAGNTGTGYMLNLTTGAGSSLKPFHVSVNGGTEALAVNAAGNVGLGTAAPSEQFTLSGGNLLASGTFGSSPAIGASGAGTRLMWYPRKAALRAGQVDASCIGGAGCWDDANIGTNSIALGNNSTASGANGTAVGTYANALGTGSNAFGSAVVSIGALSTAVGVDAVVSGDYSMALGLSNVTTTTLPTVSGTSSLGIFMQDQHNKILSANNTMGLFGGRLVIDPASQATLLSPSPNTDLNVNGNIGAVNYCDVNGNNCFTTAGVAALAPGAPVNSVQFNNAGSFGGSGNLIWDNTNGRLGIGGNSAGAYLQIKEPDSTVARRMLSLTDAVSGADWDLWLGSEPIPYLYLGGAGSTTEYFWRGNWNDTTVPALTFKSPSGTAAQPVVGILGAAGQTGDYLQLTSNGGTAGDRFVVKSTGRVGIGTNAPGTQLTLSDGATQSLSIDSISNPMRINAGSANLSLQVNSNNMIILNSAGATFPSPAGSAVSITPGAVAAGAPVALTLTGAAHTGLTASTETPDVYFNLARNEQWAAGALAMQRAVKIAPPTYRFAGASALTDAATVGIMGAPVQGTNATVTNTYGLLISAGAVGAATNSYGLTVNAQTGATNNYAAALLGGKVGIGTASPSYRFSVSSDEGNVSGENIQFSFGRSVGAFSGIVGGYYGNGATDNGAFLRANNSVPLYIGTSTTHQALTILDNGRVGISATGPATALDVGGTLRIADGGEACAAGTAGGIRYNGGNVQYCNGTTWSNIASGATVNLGTLATATNPQRSGQANTGFYTPAANQVAVSANGIQTMLWDTTAGGANYFTVASGVTGTAPTLGNAGTDTSGAGLGVRLLGRSASAAGAGGGVALNAGTGSGANLGGGIVATAGQGGATGAGGAVSITGGAGGATSGNAGGVTIQAGTPVAGSGGSINITASSGVGTNQNGGNVTLTAGGSTGIGTAGVINLTGGNVGVRNTLPGALLDIGTAGSTLGTMRLSGNTSGYVQMQSAPAAGSWTITLPAGPPGVNGYVLSSTTGGITSWVAPGGVAGPAGSDKQVQFNDGSILAGNANLTFDKTTTTLATPVVSATTKVTLGLTGGANAPASTTPVATISTQVFTASGTYTAPGNLLYAIVEVVGGGGGGGGVVTGANNRDSTGGGGGGGGYAREVLTAATIGVSQAVTIGAGGTAGTNAGGNGGTGGTSQFGAGPLLSATGGTGGAGTAANGAATATAGGAGGTGSGGDLNVTGSAGAPGFGISNTVAYGGGGGSSVLGGGAAGTPQPNNNTSTAGVTPAATAYGGGGSGAVSNGNGGAQTGGAGRSGVVVVTEYKY